MAVASFSVYRFCAVFRGCFASVKCFKTHRSIERSSHIPEISWAFSGPSFPSNITHWCERLASSVDMAPKGRSAKAKGQVEENGKEKRTRNVKTTSYKDLSDSEDEKAVKTESEESNSEEEKPQKRRGAKRKPTPRRKPKGSSESESEFHSSEDSDDKPSRKKRQPVRSSVRASKSKSYKDLSNSEEESEPPQSSARSKKDKKRQQKKPQKISDNESENEESSESEKNSSLEEVDKKPDESGDNKSVETKEKSEDSVEEEKSSGLDETSSTGNGSTENKDNIEAKESPVESKTSETKKEESSERGEESSNSSGRPEHELSEEDEKPDKTESLTKKRGRPKKNDQIEPPSKKSKPNDDQPKLNRTDSDFKSIDFSSSATNADGKLWNFKISSWNVAGLKALLKKNGLEYFEHEKPDILCLQETKCSENKLPPEAKIEGYHCYWLTGDKEGYAGVALLSKEKPAEVKYGIDNKDFDTEGRVITAEYEKFFLVNVYVPNAGQGLKSLPRRMEWDPAFRAYLKKLDEKKPVILCGDLNVAHGEIDLANPKTNTKSAGFTPQEREGLSELLKQGFVDSFRHKYPEKTGAYTFWTYFQQARSRNVGWRLDYFILSERLLPNFCDNVMRDAVYGSDHCPITLLLNI